MTTRLKRMELIGQFTGLRRSRGKKMEVLKEKSGNTLPDISAIGKIIRRTASVFISIRTAISMRVFGKETNAMVRVPIGEMRLENCAVNIQETGMKTRNMEEALSSTKTEIAMTGIGLQACLKGKAE